MHRYAFVTAAVLLLPLVVWATSFTAEWLPISTWRETLRGAGPAGATAFLLGGLLATAVGFPRQLVAGVGGYAYGFVPGALLSLLAAIGGCTLTVVVARRFLSEPVGRYFPRQVDWLWRVTRTDVFMKIIVMRLQPLGTNLATNLAAGVIGLKLPVFISASLLGYIPQTLVFALAGSGVAVGSHIEIAVAAALFLISLVLAAVLWKRHRLAANLH